jgi:DNA-binding response OmpR family regulator
MSSTKNFNDPAPLIILADDDPAIRLMLHHILQRDGYRVMDARNGREVMDLYQHNQPSLVLLDVVMPEQDGFETCRQLKEKQPDLPVLMITGLDDDQSVEQAFHAGADDYISKPINWSVFKHRIARSLPVAPPHSELDKRIYNNQIKISYRPRMDLASSTISGIEVKAEIPLSTSPGASATRYLLNNFATGYLNEKNIHATANGFSLPLWPLPASDNTVVDSLTSLKKTIGLPLENIQIRIHECFFHNESAIALLSLLKSIPVETCIDSFSFSLRSLDFITQTGCQNLLIDIAKTRKCLEDKILLLDNAVEIYRKNGATLYASNICNAKDLELANNIGCVSGSGPAIFEH